VNVNYVYFVNWYDYARLVENLSQGFAYLNKSSFVVVENLPTVQSKRLI